MISDYKLARQYDGATMGNRQTPEFNYRVFVPGWWQIWRWFTYWTAAGRGRVLIHTGDGRQLSVRSIAVKAPRRLIRRSNRRH